MFGVGGIFGDSDGNDIHELNEGIRSSALYNGRDFLFDLAKIYATQRSTT